MGQRHQIYVALPYEFKQEADWDGKKHVEHNVVALHHQWLYGVTAGQQLLQFLQFCEKGLKNERYFIFGEDGKYVGSPEEAVSAMYAVNFSEGYYSRNSIEPNPVARDPRLGDNNDGIVRP